MRDFLLHLSSLVIGLAIFPTAMRATQSARFLVREKRFPDRERGWWNTTKGYARLVADAFVQTRTRYHAFISFKSDPDAAVAAAFARDIEACGLGASIFLERLEREELADNVGIHFAISSFIYERLLQSSGVVLIASRSSFESEWVRDEFAFAMQSLELVVIVI